MGPVSRAGVLMATRTSAQLHQIHHWAGQTDDKATAILTSHQKMQGQIASQSAKWIGHGGNKNQEVLTALEGAVTAVVRKLRECAEAGRSVHANYTAGDQHQGDTVGKTVSHF